MNVLTRNHQMLTMESQCDNKRYSKPDNGIDRSSSIKQTKLCDIHTQRSGLCKRGAVHRLMYAMTMLLQPFGSNDVRTLFEIIRPVCFIAGWRSPDSVRPLRKHQPRETFADQYAAVVASREAILLRGLYCKMLHDTDYPGDILYDLGSCLATRVPPETLQLDIGTFHKEMEYRMNYIGSMLGRRRRHTLRVLHFICLAIKNGEIGELDVIEFSDMFPQAMFVKSKAAAGTTTTTTTTITIFSLSTKSKEHNYCRARQRSLGMIADRKLREHVDELVSEVSVGHLIVAITTMNSYSNLTAALAWDTLSTLE
jgi:hypothetical protein